MAKEKARNDNFVFKLQFYTRNVLILIVHKTTCKAHYLCTYLEAVAAIFCVFGVLWKLAIPAPTLVIFHVEENFFFSLFCVC